MECGSALIVNPFAKKCVLGLLNGLNMLFKYAVKMLSHSWQSTVPIAAQVNGSTLKLRLEALAKFIETREVQTKQVGFVTSFKTKEGRTSDLSHCPTANSLEGLGGATQPSTLVVQ